MNAKTILALAFTAISSLAGCDDAPAANADQDRFAPMGKESEVEAARDDGFGDLAFSTYRGGGSKLVFVSDTKVKKTWKNMSGKAVYGTYKKAGRDIVVTWDPAASNHGSLSAKYRQLGPCSLAYHERVDKKGVVHDEISKVLERKKPRCNEIRISR